MSNLGGYPAGVSEADFKENPFDTFYENWSNFSSQMLQDWIEENPGIIAQGIYKDWSFNDYIEAFKEDNLTLIEKEYENE